MKNLTYLALALALLMTYSCKEDEEMELATCTDGLQNGTETGVDCGGDCGPCLAGPPSSGSYFYGIIDGEEVIVTGANGQGAGSSSCGNMGVRSYLNGGIWQTLTSSGFEFEAQATLTKNYFGSPSADWFYEMFSEGSYSYDPVESCNTTGSQVVIGWVDESGENWYSSNGEQSGSEFEITDRGARNGLSAPIKGRFSCKLYSSSGAIKIVESGEFSFTLGLF